MLGHAGCVLQHIMSLDMDSGLFQMHIFLYHSSKIIGQFSNLKNPSRVLNTESYFVMNILIRTFSGMKNYCERYGETIYNVSRDFGKIEKWGGETGERINLELEAVIPVDQLVERRRWRDGRLAALAKLKKKIAEEANR